MESGRVDRRQAGGEAMDREKMDESRVDVRGTSGAEGLDTFSVSMHYLRVGGDIGA
jgi:hypothetical protein